MQKKTRLRLKKHWQIILYIIIGTLILITLLKIMPEEPIPAECLDNNIKHIYPYCN